MYSDKPQNLTQYKGPPKTINVPLRKYNELLMQRLYNLNTIEESKEKIKKLESQLFWYRLIARFALLLIIFLLFSYVPKYNDLKTENKILQDEYNKTEEYKEDLKEKFDDLNYSYQLLKEDYDNLINRNKSSSQGKGLLQQILSSSSYNYSISNTSSYNYSGNNTSFNKPAVVEYYIGNKNSKIFHRNYCGSATQMNDSNKIRFDTKDAAIDAGYKRCGNCHP